MGKIGSSVFCADRRELQPKSPEIGFGKMDEKIQMKKRRFAKAQIMGVLRQAAGWSGCARDLP